MSRQLPFREGSPRPKLRSCREILLRHSGCQTAQESQRTCIESLLNVSYEWWCISPFARGHSFGGVRGTAALDNACLWLAGHLDLRAAAKVLRPWNPCILRLCKIQFSGRVAASDLCKTCDKPSSSSLKSEQGGGRLVADAEDLLVLRSRAERLDVGPRRDHLRGRSRHKPCDSPGLKRAGPARPKSERLLPSRSLLALATPTPLCPRAVRFLPP